MKDRIQKILEAKNLTPSAFADEVDLSRAVVSHILHGRNKLSLDNMEKILLRYTDINPLWLISGKGSMYQDGADNLKNPSLFDESELFSGIGTDNSEYSRENSSKTAHNTIKQPEIQIVKPQISASPKVKKIAVFYSDNTYEEFVPGPKG
jgi:transcriptional regulator with XRE-family HTH domain